MSENLRDTQEESVTAGEPEGIIAVEMTPGDLGSTFVTSMSCTVLPQRDGVILTGFHMLAPLVRKGEVPVVRVSMTWAHFERTYILLRRMLLRSGVQLERLDEEAQKLEDVWQAKAQGKDSSHGQSEASDQ